MITFALTHPAEESKSRYGQPALPHGKLAAEEGARGTSCRKTKTKPEEARQQPFRGETTYPPGRGNE